MGYRSDVAIGIGFLRAEDLVKFMAKLTLSGETDVVHEMNDHYGVQDIDYKAGLGGQIAKGVMLTAFWESVKWYEGYLDVQASNKLLHFAEEAGFPTVFVRIGENIDDVEHTCTEPPYPDDAPENGTPDIVYLSWALQEQFEIIRRIEHPVNPEAPRVSDFLNNITPEEK